MPDLPRMTYLTRVGQRMLVMAQLCEVKRSECVPSKGYQRESRCRMGGLQTDKSGWFHRQDNGTIAESVTFRTRTCQLAERDPKVN